ncbi:MAG: glycosyl transferase family 2 [Myxococcales bacterium]|nr:glycosyl transferase family 2 [Myxococcales bacterium]
MTKNKANPSNSDTSENGAQRTKAPDATVVIPVYNEEILLEQAVTDFMEALKAVDWSYEIIITENGSKDQTVEIATALAERIENVRFLHTGEPNYGLALRRGIKEARGTYVLCDEIDICDVEFHSRAMDILQADKCDMVVGSKAHKDANDPRPMMRRVATQTINMMLRVSLGFKGTDTHGLKAFRRERLLPVVDECIVDKDLFASEFVIRAERGGYRILEIPVEIEEKRAPSINLYRRVPNVLKNLGRLIMAIRFNRDV